MADTLPVSNQPTLPPAPTPAAIGAVVPEQPQTTPPPAPVPVSTPQTVPSVVSEGSDLTERSDPSSQYAGFGARFLAAVLDSFIVGTIGAVIITLTFMLGGVAGVIRAEWWNFVEAALMFGLQVLIVGYYVYFTAKGQTLGKKALKIRVVRVENGEAPGYTKAFLREVVGKMLSAMVFGLGYLWMLWDGKKQTWHDKIAGTVVVKV